MNRPVNSPAPLVAVILAKNEAAHIAECIACLRDWVELVIVWDSGSSDATCALARAAGAEVVHRPFDNFAAQRQAVLDTLTAEWVLFVDADERATPELAAEIRARLASDDPAIDGYWLPRRNFIAGQETRWGGYYPDYQLRLLRRAASHYGRAVHEIATVQGQTALLQSPLIHYNYRDWAHFHAKQVDYARFEAHLLAERGIRPRPHNFVLQPLREFRRRYITLRGYRDGAHGLRLAAWLAWYYGFMPYWHLRQHG